MINSIYEATRKAGSVIENRTQSKIEKVRYINKNRHCILTTNRNQKYWVMFKRQLFKSYGEIFNMSGAGESINAEFLCKALNLTVDGLLYVSRRGKVYYASPREIINFNQTRTTKGGERTYSVPARILKSWGG